MCGRMNHRLFHFYTSSLKYKQLVIGISRNMTSDSVTVAATNTNFKFTEHVGNEREIIMIDQDNLKYSIQFPKSALYRTKNEITPVINEERPPVVVMFGWSGSLDRHLRKYSEIYEDRGLITLRHTTNAKQILWKRYQLQSVGQRFVRLLEEVNLDQYPIIVHCFSIGGSYLYKNFACALTEIPNRIQKEMLSSDDLEDQ